MNSSITIGDDLKALLAKCKPGSSKTVPVTATMDKDGKLTLSAGESAGSYEAEPGEVAPMPKKKKVGDRPKPVMAALGLA